MAISEEVRGLAIEYDIPIFSATQSNRGGSGNEELAITDISECVSVNTTVIRNNERIKITELKEGDKILSHNGEREVKAIMKPKNKDCIRIKTKSGKTVIVSKSHKFPTPNGRMSFLDGLRVGTKLNIMS